MIATATVHVTGNSEMVDENRSRINDICLLTGPIHQV